MVLVALEVPVVVQEQAVNRAELTWKRTLPRVKMLATADQPDLASAFMFVTHPYHHPLGVYDYYAQPSVDLTYLVLMTLFLSFALGTCICFYYTLNDYIWTQTLSSKRIPSQRPIIT